jgi:spermidine/putrescine transport system substrate-binding protein
VNSAGTYDIIIPSDYMIQKLIGDGSEENCMLEPFDATTIENYAYIDDSFKNMYYDPENLYSVPYTYGMMGVIYNSELVDEVDYKDNSWNLLWNEKYKGKILQFNNPRDAFGTAMYLEGLDINSKDIAVWNKAFLKLSEQKALVQGYVSDEVFNKMTTASAAIAPYYAGDFLTMASDNEDLSFYYPREGTNYFVDAMCIPKNSKHKDIAKEYINFMLSEEIAVANALYIGYASPNTLIYNSDTGYINPEYEEGMLELTDKAIEILYGASPDDVNAGYNEKNETACYKSFTPEIQEHINTLWESLKTQNATPLWVHITTAVIVVGVATLIGYTEYIKKKRSKFYRKR